MKQFEEKTGLLVSETHPFSGASPDGRGSHSRNEEACFERRGDSRLEDAMCRQGIYKKVDSGFTINKNHKYYFQLQQPALLQQTSKLLYL